MDIGFTASMEEDLDHIEVGKKNWVKIVKDFYKPFHEKLSEAAAVKGKVKPEDIATEEICQNCSKPMVIRWGRHGRFYACTGFPECKTTKPLEGEGQAGTPETTDEKCPKCEAPMIVKSGRFGKFIACSNYPACKTTKPVSTGMKCPLDGGDIVERRSKRGKFWGCGNYPNCTFVSWYKPVPEKCPKCGAAFLAEKWDKAGNVTHICLNKECGHKAEIRKEETQTAD
jgi:DNA topoisomerase-1